MPKRNVAVARPQRTANARFPSVPSLRDSNPHSNLGAGRTAAEVAPIGGNRTTAKIPKFINGIPQILQQLVGRIASCCA